MVIGAVSVTAPTTSLFPFFLLDLLNLHRPLYHLASGPSFPSILPAAARLLSFAGDSGFATLCLWPAMGQLP